MHEERGGRLMHQNQLSFDDMVRINSQTDMITMNKERVAMLSVEALGVLRKDLISTLGEEGAKIILLRYGWLSGVKAAEFILSKLDRGSLKELILAGPSIHTIQGLVRARGSHLTFDDSTLHFSGYWEDSVEASEHLSHYGPTNTTVCWTLEGFASGYLTKVFGKDVLASEDKCVAKGDASCSFIARTVKDCEKNLTYYRQYYKADSLTNAWQIPNHQIAMTGQNTLEFQQIQEKLTNILLDDKGLKEILDFLASLLNRSIVLDYYEREIKGAYLSDEHEAAYNHWKNQCDEDAQVFQTYQVQTNKIHFGRLVIVGDTKMDMREELIVAKTLETLSIKLFHKWKLTRSLWKKKESFFKDLLNAEDIDNYQRISHLFNFNPEGTNRIMTLRIYPETKQSDVLEYLTSLYSTKDIFQKDNNIIIINEDSEKSTQDFYLEFKNNLKNDFQSLIIHIGVGRISKNLNSLINSYQDSYKITDFLYLTHPDQSYIAFFEQLEPLMLLLKGTDQRELISFYHSTIGQLVKHDQNHETNLLETLKVYLDNNGNLQQTSNDLYLSISGLRYRMERIENLCDTHLNTGDERFKYQLAIRIHYALKINKLTKVH